jgi:hypothetical protein
MQSCKSLPFWLGRGGGCEEGIELYHKVAQQNIREEYLSGLAYKSLSTIYITGLPGIQADGERAAEFAVRAKELGFEM